MDLPDRVIRSVALDMFGDVSGIGVDLVDIELMRSLVDAGGPSFVDAYWTAAEQNVTGRRVERLAGRWAAKEAVMKSLGSGVGEIDPIDIEITAQASGAPEVVLHGGAAERAKELSIKTCHVSITHESSWAAAFAFAVQA